MSYKNETQAAKVTRTGAQSVLPYTPTVATFENKVFGNYGMVDITGNPDRITITSAGIYSIVGNVAFVIHNTGRRVVSVTRFNAAAASQESVSCVAITTVAEVGNAVVVSAIFNCNIGDYITLNVYQDSGATLTLSPVGLAVARI